MVNCNDVIQMINEIRVARRKKRITNVRSRQSQKRASNRHPGLKSRRMKRSSKVRKNIRALSRFNRQKRGRR